MKALSTSNSEHRIKESRRGKIGRAFASLMSWFVCALLSYVICTAAHAQGVQRQPVSEELFGVHALLLAPEAKPNWLIQGVSNAGQQLTTSIERSRYLVPQGLQAGRVTIISANAEQGSAIVGQSNRYFLAPDGTAPRLSFVVYIVIPPNLRGADCDIGIQGKPSTPGTWRFADVAQFRVICDGREEAALLPTPVKRVRSPATLDLPARLTSRWINDPFNKDAYALLMVTESAKAKTTMEIVGGVQYPLRVCRLARQPEQSQIQLPNCREVDAAPMLSGKTLTAQGLAPSLKNTTSDGVFQDFELPFVREGKAIGLTAHLRAVAKPDKMGMIVIVLRSLESFAQAETAVGAPPTPLPSPRPQLNPPRRTLRLLISNQGFCEESKCPIKVSGKREDPANLEKSRTIGENVTLELEDDWTLKSAHLQSINAGKRIVIDVADRESLKLDQDIKAIDEYELELTLQKKAKTVFLDIRYEPDPAKLGIPMRRDGADATKAGGSPAGRYSIREDYQLKFADLRRLIPDDYEYYIIKSANGAARNSEPEPLPADGTLKLAYPAAGRSEASYVIEVTPAPVTAQVLRDVRFRGALSFGGYELPIENCGGELRSTRDPDLRLRLAPDPKGTKQLVALSNDSRSRRPIYMADAFTFELESSCRNTFGDAHQLAESFQFRDIPRASPFKLVLQTTAQLFVSYVAATEGNDSKYWDRWINYLSFLNSVYAAGQIDQDSQGWPYGLVLSQNDKDDVIRFHEPRFPTPQLIERPMPSSLVNKGYETRRAPRPFAEVSPKIADEMALGPSAAWSLIYIDESFTFGTTCAMYRDTLADLRLRGLKRALVIVPGELDRPAGKDIGWTEFDKGRIKRCELGNDPKFRVYSFSKKQLTEARDYSILRTIQENLKKSWY